MEPGNVIEVLLDVLGERFPDVDIIEGTGNRLKFCIPYNDGHCKVVAIDESPEHIAFREYIAAEETPSVVEDYTAIYVRSEKKDERYEYFYVSSRATTELLQLMWFIPRNLILHVKFVDEYDFDMFETILHDRLPEKEMYLYMRLRTTGFDLITEAMTSPEGNGTKIEKKAKLSAKGATYPLILDALRSPAFTLFEDLIKKIYDARLNDPEGVAEISYSNSEEVPYPGFLTFRNSIMKALF